MTFEDYFGDWTKIINKEDISKVTNKVYREYCNKECEPSYTDIFKVFNKTNYKDLNTVMIFQDPYFQKGIATGIALGNKNCSEKLSPSLEVVKESVINFEKSHNCCTFDPTLEEWSRQGILLLNSALTVEVGKPGSHFLLWRDFMKKFLITLGEYNPGLIYILWGNTAKSYESCIKNPLKIIKLPHPSYYARNNIKIPYSVFTELKSLVKGYFDLDLKLYNELKFD